MPPPIMRNNRNPQTKAKTDFKALGKIFVFGKKYISFVCIAIIFAIAGSVATIIGPEKISDLMNKITDGMFGGIDISGVTRIGITLIIIYAVGAFCSYAQQFIMATITQKISQKLRSGINQKLSRLPLKYYDSTTKGEILSTVTNDIDAISQALSMSFASLIAAIVLFFGVIYKMFATNWILAFVTIGSSLIGFYCMSIIVKLSQKHFNNRQQQLAEMNGQIEEVYTNHNIVKVFGGEKSETKKFNKISGELYASNWKSQALSGMMPQIINFVGNLSYVLIFIVGVSFILKANSAITLGTLMAFVIYSRLFSQPLGQIAQGITNLQQASAASRRVFNLLEQEEVSKEENSASKPTKVEGNVEFIDVHFGYLPNKEIIHGFSAKIKHGQKVAIVGPTGAGKTTIVNLLMRFYEIEKGDIKIDGISIKDISRSDVRNMFDMILQDTWLFSGTIRDNLVFNTPNISDEKLDEVCNAVGISHFIDALPNGYNTVLSDNVALSEGQKQQLTIARAMIKDAPLLILDEATSSVDTRTELQIQKAMDKITRNRTSFIIAHRLSTIKNADLILVIENGNIVEQGTHSELLAAGGNYAELYNSQFVTEE